MNDEQKKDMAALHGSIRSYVDVGSLAIDARKVVDAVRMLGALPGHSLEETIATMAMAIGYRMTVDVIIATAARDASTRWN